MKWEYETVLITNGSGRAEDLVQKIDKTLAELGHEYWELVSTTKVRQSEQIILILKRPLQV